MIKNISQSFFSFLYKKKILITVFLGAFLFSAKSALALGFIDSITNGFKYLPAYLFYGIAFATNGLANLSTWFFGWIAKSASLLSYTRPGVFPSGNPIIKAGFDVTLSLVNMILVMALIFIALTTILRLKEYETKKLLTRFIIIALIVNFSPVICGLVVDASNIVTFAFLLQAGDGGSAGVADEIWKSTGNICNNSIVKDKDELNWGFTADAKAGVGEVIGDCVMQSVAYVILFFVYLLFALLFLLRMFAIWILVILSPIAFACAVLPATKKYWDEWLNNFISWCMIGVTGGFFVWLGGYMASKSSEIMAGMPGLKDGVPGASILALIVPIIFLVIGFSYSLKTGLSGASMVSGFVGGLAAGALTGTLAGAKGMTKWTGKQAIKQTAGRVASSEWGKKALSGMAQGTWGGDTLRQSGSAWKRAAGRVLGTASWTSRKAGAAGLNASTVSQEAKIAKLEGEYKTKYGDDTKSATAINKSFGPTQVKEKIAMARHLSKTRGGFGELPIADQRKAIQLAAKHNPGSVSGLVKSNPQAILDPVISRTLQQMPQRPFGGAVGDVVQMDNVIPKMNAENFKNLNRDSYDINKTHANPTEQARIRATAERFLDSLSERGTGGQIKSFVDEQGRGASDALEQNLSNMATRRGYPNTRAMLTAINPRLLAYLQSQLGQGLINIP